jgi:hypothetical protein
VDGDLVGDLVALGFFSMRLSALSLLFSLLSA